MVGQQQTSAKEFLGSIDLKPQQLAHPSARSLVAEPTGIDPESLEIFLRQINSSQLSIATHILAKIRQLQSRANLIGQPSSLCVKALGQIQHEVTDGIGRAAAIVLELGERLVPLDPPILPKGIEQCEERLAGDLEPLDRGPECSENGMSTGRSLVITLHEPCFPFVQPPQAFRIVHDPVGEIIGEAAIGVEVVEILAKSPGREQPADDEVLVMGERQSASEPLSIAKRVSNRSGLFVGVPATPCAARCVGTN